MFNKYYYTYLFSESSVYVVLRYVTPRHTYNSSTSNYTTKHKSIINYTKQISLTQIITKHKCIVKYNTLTQISLNINVK